MGCFLVLAAFISARFAIFLTWIFTNRMTVAFNSGFVGFVGFLFLPWTTLTWTWVYQPVKGVEGFGLILVIFAFLIDLASIGGGGAEGRRRRSSRNSY